jgi:hypothetical protein
MFWRYLCPSLDFLSGYFNSYRINSNEGKSINLSLATDLEYVFIPSLDGGVRVGLGLQAYRPIRLSDPGLFFQPRPAAKCQYYLY